MSPKVPSRLKESKQLANLIANNNPEFLALFGRRRIGKTFLIRHFFSKMSGIFLEITGLKNGKMNQQLEIFNRALMKAFNIPYQLKPPTSWMEAFESLSVTIEKLSGHRWVFLFFDELPWLATKRSGLIQSIDHYWNTRWSKREKLIFIGCGSSAYWMIHHLINAKGGLHNRVTASLNLQPFTLGQTKTYLTSQGLKLSTQQILHIYMAVGGVPHYLNQFKPNTPFVKTLDMLCFNENGLLFNEFDNLFQSLFNNCDVHLKIIKAIAKYTYGISREALIQQLKQVSSGGRLTQRLEELEKAGFIKIYSLYGYKEREIICRVIDEYVLFYLTWIIKFKKQFKVIPNFNNYWSQQFKTQPYKTWCGYAFELVCLKHVDKIISALEINELIEGIGPWRFVTTENNKSGTQIDLLLNRSDGFISICEIKYNESPFVINKNYANVLKQKLNIVENEFKKQGQIVFITAGGLKQNAYSRALVTAVITIDDLMD